MALCLRVPKVSEPHSALRRELVWHVVYVPRHPSAVYGSALVGEIESNVIVTEVCVRGSVVCVDARRCVFWCGGAECALKHSVDAIAKERISRRG